MLADDDQLGGALQSCSAITRCARLISESLYRIASSSARAPIALVDDGGMEVLLECILMHVGDAAIAQWCLQTLCHIRHSLGGGKFSAMMVAVKPQLRMALRSHLNNKRIVRDVAELYTAFFSPWRNSAATEADFRFVSDLCKAVQQHPLSSHLVRDFGSILQGLAAAVPLAKAAAWAVIPFVEVAGSVALVLRHLPAFRQKDGTAGAALASLMTALGAVATVAADADLAAFPAS